MKYTIVRVAGVFSLAISLVAGIFLPNKAVLAAEQPLIISAVQTTGGEGKTNDDFIELYNPNTTPFNLNGYRLVKRSGAGTTDSSIKSWSADTYIPPHSFYLWANTNFTALTPAADSTTSSTLADNNGIGLRFGANDTGTLVDSLSWGTANNGFVSTGLANPEGGKSIVRTNLFESPSYAITASQPRNSTVSFMPSSPVPAPQPNPVPEQINDATCSMTSSGTNTEDNKEINSIVFTNTGNTTWTPQLYTVKGSNTEDVELINNQTVTPGQSVVMAIQLPAPTQAGYITFTWQMVYNGTVFGDACSLGLSFVKTQDGTVPVPEPQTVPDPVPTPNPDPIPTPTPNPQPTPVPTQSNSQQVTITELLVNPEGKDDGAEVVELYNAGDTEVDLNNWIIDDIAEGVTLTSDKYVLSTMHIAPKSYLAVTLPAGKAVLNNSKGDVVSLIDSSGQFIDTVSYSIDNSPEGKSLSLFNLAWVWGVPTLGAVNIAPPVEEEEEVPVPQPANVKIEGLEISEIYPAPSKGAVEFLELYNRGTKTINLSNVVLKVGDKVKTLKAYSLLPGKYVVLQDETLPLSLLDKGAKIILEEINGTLVDSTEYLKATKGQSYVLYNGQWAWTTTITPGTDNIITVPVNAEKEKTVVTKKTTITTKSTPTKTTTVKKTTVKTSGVNSKKTNNSLPKNNLLVSTSSSDVQDPENHPETEDKNKLLNVLAVIAASISAGSFVVYKFAVGGI